MKRAITLFWAVIAFGVIATPIVAIGVAVAKGSPVSPAVAEWLGHLFEPGYNEFLLVLIAAFPFIIVAVFGLLHLSGDTVSRGRWYGMAGGLAAGGAMTLWILLAIRTSRSSTAAIGYIFMPPEVLVAMIFGYVAGRLIARLVPA